MEQKLRQPERFMSAIEPNSWKAEIENQSSRYHYIAAWVAIIFDPLFGITDYFNIPGNWHTVLWIRLSIAAVTLGVLAVRKRFKLPSHVVVLVPFMLISLQNAFTYTLIENNILLGHNLNYTALFIGGGFFILWDIRYSLFCYLVSALAFVVCFSLNPQLHWYHFFINGGLLLCAVASFMVILINARYNLTRKEIIARLALKASNDEINKQADEIRHINENLEKLVAERTNELEKKNKALKDYAFINGHKLRGPVAHILGLIQVIKLDNSAEDQSVIISHLEESTRNLDSIVADITSAIEMRN